MVGWVYKSLAYILSRLPPPANLDHAGAHIRAVDPRATSLIEDDHLSAQELYEVSQRAQANLKSVELLVRRTGRDTSGFGMALEGSANDIAHDMVPHPALTALVELTKTMIEKTKIAEDELRISAQSMAQLQLRLSDAQAKADTDALTGLSNRRAFERSLGAAGERARSKDLPLSLAFCDIDHFKLVNDTHGHDAGDRVLKFVGHILQKVCGPSNRVARHGGEEFVILFEGKSAEQAFEIIDAARQNLVGRNIIDKSNGTTFGNISFSAGVSDLQISSDVSKLLRDADAALYTAKSAGRNCIRLAA